MHPPLSWRSQFFFVGGVGPREVTTRVAGRLCPGCGQSGTLEQRRVDHVLSLFFVPLLTVARGQPDDPSCYSWVACVLTALHFSFCVLWGGALRQ